MRLGSLSGFAVSLIASICLAQEQPLAPGNRTVFGVGVGLISQGGEAIRLGLYDEGIELTKRGLEEPGTDDHARAAALSNLCAAYAVKNLPDTAIAHCTESLAIDNRNWRAFSNRSYAYWVKGQLANAEADLEAAQALNPNARQVAEIRGMINESGLRPHVTVEDLQ
jgi:tetratricopeptide (TPR) repeat protein